jgi:N-acetylneuraminic acid mutarotase
VVAANGRVYVIGGRVAGNSANNLGVNEMYDPAANHWTTQAPLPTARSGIGAAFLTGEIYVLGGETTGKTFDENEVYDPAADHWTTAAQLPTARHGIGVVAFNGIILVIGGGKAPGGNGSTVNEIFYP